MEDIDLVIGKIHNQTLEVVEFIEEMRSLRDLDYLTRLLKDLRSSIDEFLKRVED